MESSGHILYIVLTKKSFVREVVLNRGLEFTPRDSIDLNKRKTKYSCQQVMPGFKKEGTVHSMMMMMMMTM